MLADSYFSFSNFEPGRDHPPIEVDSSEAVSRACIALFSKAAREVVIMTRELDPLVLNNSEANLALRQFLLSSRRTRLRILVKDVDAVARRGHRIVELAQRLTSFCEIRVPAAEFADYNSAFVVVDAVAVLYRSFADRFEGSVSFNNRLQAQELLRHFDEMWQTSATAPGLRRLSL